MGTRERALAAAVLERLARRQEGVVSREQALNAGLTQEQVRWPVASGDWQRIHPGVYLTHTGALGWAARAWAGLLRSGEGSALILDAAVHVWRIGTHEPQVITIGVPHARRGRTLAGIEVTRRRRLDCVLVGGLRTTRVAQTILDLADDPTRALDEVIAVAARAGQLGRVTEAQLRAELAAPPRHQRRREMELVLGEIGAGAESLPEVLFTTRVQRSHGLPEMERQVRAEGESTRADLVHRGFGVRVEVDGRLWHAGERFHTDRRRDRKSAGAGEATLRVTPLEIDREPCEIGLEIATVLRQRGWTGRFTACSPQCAAVRQT